MNGAFQQDQQLPFMGRQKDPIRQRDFFNGVGGPHYEQPFVVQKEVEQFIKTFLVNDRTHNLIAARHRAPVPA
jgi:hypothetical protein